MDQLRLEHPDVTHACETGYPYRASIMDDKLFEHEMEEADRSWAERELSDSTVPYQCHRRLLRVRARQIKEAV